jgi:hypothetical protein
LQQLVQELLLAFLDIILQLFSLLFLIPFNLLFIPFIFSDHRVYSDQIHPHLFDCKVLVFDPIEQHLLVFLLPLLSFCLQLLFLLLFRLLEQFALSAELHYLLFLVLQGLSKQLVPLRLGDKFFGFLKVLQVYLHAFVDCFRELLDVLYFLGVLLVDLSDDFKGSVGLAEDFEDFLTVVVDSCFLFYLHAIVSSFCAFNVKVDLAIMFGALDNGSSLRAFFATNHATDAELREV